MNTKKENKAAYKQMKFKIGIYQIINLESRKIYLKSSADLDRAFNSDKFKLTNGLHSNKELQADWITSKAECFEFKILDCLETNGTETELEIKNDLRQLLELHRNELLGRGTLIY